MSNGNDLLNALNRLQRIGEELSGTNRKLITAAQLVADEILNRMLPLLPSEYSCFNLPRGYFIARGPYKDTIGRCLARRKNKRGFFWLYAVNSTWRAIVRVKLQKLKDAGASEEDIMAEEIFSLPNYDVQMARVFADDIAAGLLDEITDFFQRVTNSTAAALQTLEAAKHERT